MGWIPQLFFVYLRIIKGYKMAIKSIKTKKQLPIEIDLTGPDGNAFALMGYAKSLSKQLDYDHKRIIGKMTSGDYEHLLKVFDNAFGEFVTLYR